MIRAVFTAIVLGVLVLPSAAMAQTGEESPGAAEELQSLQQEYAKAMNAFMQEYQAAETAEAKSALLSEKYPASEFAEKFWAVAEKHPGTDEALTALTFVMQNAPNQEFQKKAMEVVKRDHFKSKDIVNLLPMWIYDPSKREMLEELIESSPHREVKGVAIYVLAKQQMNSPTEGEEGPDAAALLKRAVEEFGDIPMRGRTLKEVAEGDMFEATRLQVGMEAPDIIGEDIDEVAFRLSDYRGKVVLLDFWGDW